MLIIHIILLQVLILLFKSCLNIKACKNLKISYYTSILFLVVSDGLTPECFSFKRKPLGVHENYETVRDARVRKKTTEYQNKNEKCTNRNTEKLKSRKEISEGSIKERKSANLNDFYYLNEAEGEFQGNEINQCKEREVEGKKNKKIQDERDNFDINKRASVVKKKAKVELRNGKNIFKKILNVKKEKQHYGSERKTISKKIIRKRGNTSFCSNTKLVFFFLNCFLN